MRYITSWSGSQVPLSPRMLWLVALGWFRVYEPAVLLVLYYALFVLLSPLLSDRQSVGMYVLLLVLCVWAAITTTKEHLFAAHLRRQARVNGPC